jgi:hypothetical protein
MSDVVAALIRRNMKHTSTFTNADESVSLPVQLSPRDSSETIVGWYQNPSPWQDSWIVFTDAAIYSVEHERAERVAFSDIIDYESPPKTEPLGIQILTTEGPKFIRMAGSYGPFGKFKDAFSLGMVLRSLTKSHSGRDPMQ